MRSVHPCISISLSPSVLLLVFVGSACAPKPEQGDAVRDPAAMLPARITPPLPVTGPAPQDDPAEDRAEATADSTRAEAALPFVTHPNPFNPVMLLRFELPPGGAAVRLEIYGLDGRRIRRLVDARLPAGAHALAWHGRDDAGRRMASGVYFATLRSDEAVRTRKVLLLN